MKAHMLYLIFFFRKSRRSWNNVEKMLKSWRGHRCQYNTAHTLCLPGN